MQPTAMMDMMDPVLVALATLGAVAAIAALHVLLRPLTYRRDLPKTHRWKDIGDLTRVPGPYPNSWYGIADEDDVKRGQAIEVRCLGKTLVVFRGETGAVSVMDAYCPHLGANLADGTVKGDCIVCPFHGWKFDQQGHVVDVPYSTTKQPTFVKARKYPTLEVNGKIFIYYHPDGTSLNATPTWTPMAFAQAGRGRGYRFCGRVEHHVNAHLIEHPENGADAAHFNVLHGAFVVPMLQWLLGHDWVANYAPSQGPGRSHMADLSVTHNLSVFGKLFFPSTTTHVYQVGPGFVCLCMQTVFGDIVFFECTTPLAPLHQRIVHTCWAGPWVPMPMAKIAFKVMMIQLERDIAVWTRKTFVREPPLMKEEANIRRFRKWFDQFYDDDSVSMKQALEAEATRKLCGTDW
eukprot:Unigene5173_Nuclearia_a/m.15872 Unigene5173_Nuclearia_a/g.15872  ORF Unigene5173_Nuclearia_a/g.15872 Unigene5173_Nuclearia_a/m.15872 type:complete len:405 (+) Unigene5173_Nuclearia_a:1-1215(+)